MNIRLFIAGLIGVGSCFFMIAEVSADNVKIEKNPENCKKINKYGSKVDVLIAEKFKVPVSSVRFLGAKWQLFSDKRTELDFGFPVEGLGLDKPREDCILTFDTAKGPVECKEGRAFLFTDDGGVTAWTPIINKEFEDVISTCQKRLAAEKAEQQKLTSEILRTGVTKCNNKDACGAAALKHVEPKAPEKKESQLMCNSRTDKSKSFMACITKCGKGPTTENEPYQDKDGKWKSRQIICIDGSESLECSDRFSHCRENCGGGPAMCGDC